MGLLLAVLGPLAGSWSLVGTAHAAEEAEVVEALRSGVSAAGADQIVVCASGEDSEKAARRLVSAMDVELPVVRIPLIGDRPAEAERVRIEREVSCAIWVAPGTGTPWSVGTVGPCTPAPADPTLDVGPIVTDGDPDTLDADPDETAGVDASPGVVPGAVDQSPGAAVDESPRPRAPTVQLPPKLVVTEIRPDPEDLDRVRWHVVDETGVAWSTYRFAETMGDTEMLARLDADLEYARKERKVLFWTGIAGMAVSPIPLLFTEAGAYGRNADLAWTSMFLLTTGGVTFGLHKMGEKSEKRRQLRPALYYDRSDSDALVSAYNARIDARAAALSVPAPPPEPAPPAAESTPLPAEPGAPAAEPGSPAAEPAPAAAAPPSSGAEPAAGTAAPPPAAPAPGAAEEAPVAPAPAPADTETSSEPPVEAAGAAAPAPADDGASPSPADRPPPAAPGAPSSEAEPEAVPAPAPAPAAEGSEPSAPAGSTPPPAPAPSSEPAPPPADPESPPPDAPAGGAQ